ncbi:MAG: hypothetical protein JWN86_3663 [Planctomycetota bacterium]|nr:hypothetical protein [Planctomycetota bacterium]
MALRLHLGPVFSLECLSVPRRWQVFAGRVFFVALLLAGLWMIWAPADRIFTSHRDLAQIGEKFFVILVITQLIVVMLLAPAATAGSICVEKSRGTLHHVFVTDLTDREIILGKLSARLLSVFSLMACGIPVVALSGLLGGVDYGAVAGAYLVTIGVAITSCAIAMFFSVWVRRASQALLSTYALLGLWTGLSRILAEFAVGGVGMSPSSEFVWYLQMADPFALALAPLSAPQGASWNHALAYLGVSLGFSTLIVVRTIRRLRAVVIGQADRKASRQRADAPLRILDYLPGPPLDGNPVLWREWHRKRPTRWTGRFWTLYAVASTAASLFAIFAYFANPGGIGPDELAGVVNGCGVSIGLLLLTISATTSLAEERDRGSLDVIMTTPLPTATILWGKWWGTYAMVPRLAILPVWVSAGIALVSGNWLAPFAMLGLILAYSAFITSLGLGLAIWIPRLGRAIGTGIFLYLMLSICLYFARHVFVRSDISSPGGAMTVTGPTGVTVYFNNYPGSEHAWDWLNLGIPLLGIYETTRWAGHVPAWWQTSDLPLYVFGTNTAYGWTPVWIGVYVAFSAWLMLASIASFDRFLGRMTTHLRLNAPSRADPRLPAVPEPTSAHVLRKL